MKFTIEILYWDSIPFYTAFVLLDSRESYTTIGESKTLEGAEKLIEECITDGKEK